MGWFTALATGQKIAIGLVALLLIGAAYAIANSWFDETLDRAEEKGAGAAVQAGQDLTLEHIGKANEATDKIVRDVDNARYRECLRGTRTPGNCERYRKVEPVSD